MVMDPTARSTPVLAEDVDAVADTLETLGADQAVATLREAAHRLDSDDREVTPAAQSVHLSRDELVDRFTASVENACDVAAIEVEVHELDVGMNGWHRNGQTSPLRRLVRAMESAGLLDYSAIKDAS